MTVSRWPFLKTLLVSLIYWHKNAMMLKNEAYD